MVKKVFYNSSLPRSGSTLIQNILAQNPKIYSSPTSGLFGFIDAARTLYSSLPEFKAQDEKEMEKMVRHRPGKLYSFDRKAYEQIQHKSFVGLQF